jgi:hypothetical protein
VKTDIKFPMVRRVRRFLFDCIAIIWVSRLKPHPLALKKFGIRVVTPKIFGGRDIQGEVCSALELLNRHDEEKLELVKKHISTILIFLLRSEKYSGQLRTGHICVLNLQRFPIEMFSERRLISIAGSLVHCASGVEQRKLGVYLPESEVFKNICKEEQKQTVEKLSKILCE